MTSAVKKALHLAKSLLYLDAAIWLVFGIASLIRLANHSSAGWLTLLIVAALLFVNCGAMLIAAWGIGRRWRPFYYFALLLLAGNIILTFTDQFGWFDFITLLLDCALLGILILQRKAFLGLEGTLADYQR